MENPLISSDSSEPKPVQPQAPAATPAVAPASALAPAAPKPAKKKSFFTTGKILAIVGIAVVVIAIIGAVIYSQSSERFQGSALVLTHVPPGGATSVPAVSVGGTAAGGLGAEDLILVTLPTDDETTPPDGLTAQDLTVGPQPSDEDTTTPEKTAIPGDATTTPEVTIVTNITPKDLTTADEPGTEAIQLCDRYINLLRDAYYTRNWEAFQGALFKLDGAGCIDNCKSKLLWNIAYLWTGDITAAKIVNADYSEECSTCEDSFALLALNSQVISDIDKTEQEAGSTLDTDYIGYLTELAENFLTTPCPCVQLEAFLDNPNFDIGTILPTVTMETAEAMINSVNTLRTISPFPNITTGGATSANLVTYMNDDVLTIAYAQSATLSPIVISTLEAVFQVCLEVEPDPENCTALEIVNPSPNPFGFMGDISVGNNDLIYTPTGTDDIYQYQVTQTNFKIKLNGSDTGILTPDTQVALSDISPGEIDTITVQAIDAAGSILNGCSDQITIESLPTPSGEVLPDPDPETDPETDPDPEPVNCSSLEITLPSTDDMMISEDFDTATDTVEFTVTGTDNIANYHIFASNDTLVFGGQDDDVYSDYDSVTLNGGPAVDDPVTITVQAVDVTGLALTECIDSITVSRAPIPDGDPVCRSLNIIAPEDTTAIVLPAGGLSDQNLTVQIDGDQGSWGDIKYNTVSENGDITFNGDATLVTGDQTVLMNGKPSGATETITVWALDPTTGTGIASCNDSFVVSVDNSTPPSLTYTPPEVDDGPPTLAYTPPEVDDGPPSLAYTPPVVDDGPPPSLAYTPPVVVDDPPVIIDPPRNDAGGRPYRPSAPEDPEPVVPATPYTPSTPSQPGAPAPLHDAPYTPQTGPGVLIPMIGIAIGGAWMRRKKK